MKATLMQNTPNYDRLTFMSYPKPVYAFVLSLVVLLGFAHAQEDFPELTGTTLSDVEVSLPQDFPGSYTLVFLPLQQNHEATFRTWESYVKDLQTQNTRFDFYQILPLGDLNFFLKGIIGGAMKGAYDDMVRERSVPLFVETEPVFTALSIPNDSEMHVLLVQQGKIIWRSTGEWSQEKADTLEQQFN